MGDRDKLNKAITLANAGDYEGAAKEMNAVAPDSVRPRRAAPRRTTPRRATRTILGHTRPRMTAPHRTAPHRTAPCQSNRAPTRHPIDDYSLTSANEGSNEVPGQPTPSVDRTRLTPNRPPPPSPPPPPPPPPPAATTAPASPGHDPSDEPPWCDSMAR